MNKYITKKELGEQMGLARSTIQKYMVMGLPHYTYRGKAWFDYKSAKEWIESHWDNTFESDKDLPGDFLEQMNRK